MPTQITSDICLNKCFAKCCKTINVYLALPTSKEEVDAYYFYSLHNGIKIRFDKKNKALIMTIKTLCSKLDLMTNKCTIHDTKPDICRNYPQPGTMCEVDGLHGSGLKMLSCYTDFLNVFQSNGV